MRKGVRAGRNYLLALAVCLVFPPLSGLGANLALSAPTSPTTSTSTTAVSNLDVSAPLTQAPDNPMQLRAGGVQPQTAGGPESTVIGSFVPATTSSSTPLSITMASPAGRALQDVPTTTPSDHPVQLPPDPLEDGRVAPVVATFQASITPIGERLKQQMLQNGIWSADAPVPLNQLRVLQVTYWDFEGEAETGQLIVNQAWSVQLSKVFRALFDARFPLRRMDPLIGAMVDGDISIADNTRSFQARHVNGGWSMHAYGLAVDINPGENPWVRGSSVIPTAGRPFADRSVDAPGVVKPDSVVVKAFASIGWKWGGNWSSSKDFMHFSSNGH